MPHKSKEERSAYNKAYYASNIEKEKARKEAYRKANPEKIKSISKNYYTSNSEKVKSLNDQRTELLTDSYIRFNLKAQTGIQNPPKVLIQLHREIIKLKRKIYEKSRTTINKH
jgi:hypothetical protein